LSQIWSDGHEARFAELSAYVKRALIQIDILIVEAKRLSAA
jgi:hypothetical protein